MKLSEIFVKKVNENKVKYDNENMVLIGEFSSICRKQNQYLNNYFNSKSTSYSEDLVKNLKFELSVSNWHSTKLLITDVPIFLDRYEQYLIDNNLD